jgi:hypothetical protein
MTIRASTGFRPAALVLMLSLGAAGLEAPFPQDRYRDQRRANGLSNARECQRDASATSGHVASYGPKPTKRPHSSVARLRFAMRQASRAHASGSTVQPAMSPSASLLLLIIAPVRRS